MKVLNAKNMAKSRQQGFTIIELIVVILLLGILTATALPRFLDVTDEAHQAVGSAVFGGLQTGASLFRAGWIAQGQPAAGTDVTTFGAGTLEANASGWPAGTDGGTEIGSAADCIAIYNGLMQNGAPTVEATGADAAVSDVAIAAAGNDAAGNPAAFNVNFNSAADAPYAANSCYYIYTAQYATQAGAPSEGLIPIVVLEPNGNVTLTDDTDAAFQ